MGGLDCVGGRPNGNAKAGDACESDGADGCGLRVAGSGVIGDVLVARTAKIVLSCRAWRLPKRQGLPVVVVEVVMPRLR